MLWRDIYGNPALLIKVDRPRDIYSKGQPGMICFLIALLLSGLVFALVTLFIVERVILSKVGCLNRSVRDIEERRDPSARIAVEGRDEMAGLTIQINRMLGDLEKSSKEIYLSEEKLRRVTDSTLDLICEINGRGEFIYNNSAYKNILGYSLSELAGDSVYRRIHPEDVAGVRAAIQGSLTARSTGRMEFRHRHKDGQYLWMEVIGNPLFDQNGKYTGAILTMREVTERKLAEEQIRYQAYYDQLTGLPNRNLFYDRFLIALAQAKRNEQMLAVMFLDLDGFKLVNDTYGHDVGDFLLQAAASRLRGCVRAGDTVARVGGDEFTIILEGIQQAADASTVAKKIITTLEEPFLLLSGNELRVTTSIGISIYPHSGEEMESLVKNADSAMYKAKQRGKNQYQFHELAAQGNIFV
jgi:diguanylate cyclase (GGDEF)-like protein/PAS domain S-box-containing protein